MVVLTEQIEIPASYEKLKAWTANFEEEFVKWSPTTSNAISITGTIWSVIAKTQRLLKESSPVAE